MNAVVGFFKEAYQELLRVQWPSKKDTIRLTLYVIGVSLATGILVSGLDYLFKEVLKVML
ncbi:MAG: hypothetical protein ACD_22C00216G0006 [uncultured bacterium]|nr:MAG: hypothetical protein ACD_22C00216G0006 [uncultured bacterium]